MTFIKFALIRRVVVTPAIRIQNLIPFMIILQIVSIQAAHVFDAYRLVQMDKGNQPLGSRRTNVNHIATVVRQSRYSKTAPPDTTSGRGSGSNQHDLSRKLVILDFKQLQMNELIGLIEEIVDQRGASGILLVLPAESELNSKAISSKQIEKWRVLEQYLMQREFLIPIYFAFNDEQLSNIIKSVQEDESGIISGSSDRYQMVVSSSEGSIIPTVSVHNFQGWHHSNPTAASFVSSSPSSSSTTSSSTSTSSTSQSSSSTSSSASQSSPSPQSSSPPPSEGNDNTPTIAIIADYDSFGGAPSLAFGVDHNGSGFIALLELVRIFARLYGEFRTHGSYNLLFVLTGGGRLNFAGVKHWLRSIDSRVLETIEFALCLDSIGGDSLYLHVSKSAKTEHVASIYSNFNLTAEQMGIPFEIVHKKINVSNPLSNWPHELFSRKKILAATLSSHLTPAPLFSRSSIFDRRSFVNESGLVRTIRFIAESLCKQIYPLSSQHRNLNVIAQAQDVNHHFVSAWLKFVGNQSRSIAHLTKAAELFLQIEKLFHSVLTDVKKTTFPLDAGFKFYTSTTEQMSSFKVKPITFDLMLFLFIIIYLCILHVVIQFPKNMEDFKQIFSLKS